LCRSDINRKIGKMFTKLRNFSKISGGYHNNTNVRMCFEKRLSENLNIKRNVSILSHSPTPGGSSLVTNEDMQHYLSIYPTIINDILDATCNEETSNYCKSHFEELLRYNLPNKSHGSGYMSNPCYKILESTENLSPENIHLASILGWCVDLIGITITMIDDIVDQSEMRLNQLCWYKLVGLKAINDIKMIEQALYVILRKYFSNHHCYVPALELLHYTFMQVAVGQTLDLKYRVKNGKNLLRHIDGSAWKTLAKYKAGYYTAAPVRLAMYLANVYDPKSHKEANSMLFKVGQLAQLDNDISDFYGETTESGKVGNDISCGQCTWLLVQAVQRGSPAQRKVLEQNYGRAEPNCENAIRDLYHEFDLYDAYVSHKRLLFEQLYDSVEHLQNERLRQLFFKWAENPDLKIERIYAG